MLGQWHWNLNTVAAIVGGLNNQEKYVGQEGVIFSPAKGTPDGGCLNF